jgi:hypothetical protein
VKTLHCLLLVAALLLGSAAHTQAQTAEPPALPRADASATFGWLTMRSSSPGPYYGPNWSDSLFASVAGGWHWTEHLKTEIDFGGGTTARAYRTEQVNIGGRPYFRSTDRRFSRRTLAIAQEYQFFHNAWFHPHVAVGANVSAERYTERSEPVYVYDEVTRTSRFVGDRLVVGPETDVTVRPFVATGFKAYMAPRAFFRSDLRVSFRGGVDEVFMRLGFGVDF